MGVQVWAVVGGVISLLIAGNIYFVKRLVDKVEKTGDGHEEVKGSVAQLSVNINAIGNQMRELKLDIKELRKIEIDVAVMRSQLNPIEVKTPSKPKPQRKES